jgi:uncharacterized protein (TIGR03435 family)
MVSLSYLIMTAYDVKHYQLAHPPEMLWLGDQFDIMARVPAGTGKEQLRLMEQSLLAERFGLKLHHEQKEMPVYELTVAKNGPKIKESAPPSEEDNPDPGAHYLRGTDAEGYPMMSPGWAGMAVMRDRKMLGAPRSSMDEFAATLSAQLGRPVLDATGLAGEYDIALRWILDSAPTTDPGPTLTTAVQSQLGLKLTPKKATIDVLVIDHLESTPTEN